MNEATRSIGWGAFSLFSLPTFKQSIKESKEMKTITIYGAGMAGLLASHMLQGYNCIIKEKQESLPNNHGALLRFRSSIVGDVTGIPFKKVNVRKQVLKIDHLRPSSDLSICDENLYSNKVLGAVIPRSIGNLDDCQRYIAPSNFIAQLAKGKDIRFGEGLDTTDIEIDRHTKPVISTIPMPALMDIVKWEHKPEFKYRPIWTITAKIESPDCNVHQTIYFPTVACNFGGAYRASIVGDTFIVESIEHPFERLTEQEFRKEFLSILSVKFGIWDVKFQQNTIKVGYQKFGKLLPIDDKLRKQFILEMSNQFNIYSLGRFATWRQILLDDVVKDIRIISDMIENNDAYARHRRIVEPWLY